MEVITKFSLPSGKLLKVLITDQSAKNLISLSVVEKIEQDERNHAYCGYYDDQYVIKFSMERYVDCVGWKISMECSGVILGRTWIAERCATYNVETCLLKLISCSQWYGLTTLLQQPNPKEPSSLKNLYRRRIIPWRQNLPKKMSQHLKRFSNKWCQLRTMNQPLLFLKINHKLRQRKTSSCSLRK